MASFVRNGKKVSVSTWPDARLKAHTCPLLFFFLHSLVHSDRCYREELCKSRERVGKCRTQGAVLLPQAHLKLPAFRRQNGDPARDCRAPRRYSSFYLGFCCRVITGLLFIFSRTRPGYWERRKGYLSGKCGRSCGRIQCVLYPTLCITYLTVMLLFSPGR
jgi:hypothetical protein